MSFSERAPLELEHGDEEVQKQKFASEDEEEGGGSFDDDEEEDETAPLNREEGDQQSIATQSLAGQSHAATTGRFQSTGTVMIFLMVLSMITYDYVFGDATFFGLRHRIAPPKNSQGPWPECLWMTGVECAKFIRTQVPKDVEIEFMHKHAVDEMITSFDPNRVIIVVNDFDAVQEAPARGRRRA